mmetsp:Transcript_16454/g.22143  ORF Transcript_16454/g.22143 Transcript_16454/m.22143 type:complete len:253 (+) Transcript_16454:90-848(+)
MLLRATVQCLQPRNRSHSVRAGREDRACVALACPKSLSRRPLADENGQPALAKPRLPGKGACACNAALGHRVLSVAIEDHDVAALEPQLRLAAPWPRNAARGEAGAEDKQQRAFGLGVAVAADLGTAIVVDDDLCVVPSTPSHLQQRNAWKELRQLVQQPVCQHVQVLHAQPRAPRVPRAPLPEHLNDHRLPLPTPVGLRPLEARRAQVGKGELLDRFAFLAIDIPDNENRLCFSPVRFNAKTILKANRCIQ